MSGHVFVVSEWLPKENCEEDLWIVLKDLMALTRERESGCISAHATRQISHQGATGKSKYKIILLQEYVDIKAFDLHCQADYVTSAFKKYIENEETALIKEWNVRLLSEADKGYDADELRRKLLKRQIFSWICRRKKPGKTVEKIESTLKRMR